MVVFARREMPSPTARKVSFSWRRRSFVSLARSTTLPKNRVTVAPPAARPGSTRWFHPARASEATAVVPGITRSLNAVATVDAASRAAVRPRASTGAAASEAAAPSSPGGAVEGGTGASDAPGSAIDATSASGDAMESERERARASSARGSRRRCGVPTECQADLTRCRHRFATAHVLSRRNLRLET